MKILSILIFLLAVNFSAFAQTLELQAEFSITSDYDEESLDPGLVKKDGWVFNKDSDVYSMKLKVPYTKLPLTKKLGPSFFSIDKSGLVKVGISLGDSDSESISSLLLPVVDGKIAILPAPLVLSNSGGEYASGVWSFEGKLTIKTVK